MTANNITEALNWLKITPEEIFFEPMGCFVILNGKCYEIYSHGLGFSYYETNDPRGWEKIKIELTGECFKVSLADIKRQAKLERVHPIEVINRLMSYHGLQTVVDHFTYQTGELDTFVEIKRENGFSHDEYEELRNGAITNRKMIEEEDKRLYFYTEAGNFSMMNGAGPWIPTGELVKICKRKTDFKVCLL